MPSDNVHVRHSAEVCLYQFNACPDCGTQLHPVKDGLECRSDVCGSVWLNRPRGPLPKDLFRVGLAHPLKPPEVTKPAKPAKGGKPPKGPTDPADMLGPGEELP